MSNVIYIGGRVTGVMTNEIFKSRPFELIAGLKSKYPLIELLFVDVEEYTAAVKERDTVGSARASAYAQTKKTAQSAA